ncbi:hypothetical protein B0H19DRAFT_1265202 [Mycena capillaripes]|nr:hypothetical protein B0H19DRAFT_1265202 [Mycena capillaripes]
MEMAETRTARVEALAIKYGVEAHSDAVDSVAALSLELSSGSSVASPSRHSSVAAVNEDPIKAPRGHDNWYADKPLARNVAPATRLQKRLRREVGLIGPLTPVQQAQVRVSELTLSVSESARDSDDEAIAPLHGWVMSSERRERVWNWRMGCTESGMGWEDYAARRAFAEAVLQQRLL